jgi:hypothetical protein
MWRLEGSAYLSGKMAGNARQLRSSHGEKANLAGKKGLLLFLLSLQAPGRRTG